MCAQAGVCGFGFPCAAKLHPSRTYYYRKNLDIDKLIEQCTSKLARNPNNVKVRAVCARVRVCEWAGACVCALRCIGAGRHVYLRPLAVQEILCMCM